MKPIPKPLLRRLVLTLLVGTGCLLVGIAFYFIEKDSSFLFLSLLIFLFSMCRAFSTLFMVKRNSYVVLEGTCQSIHPMLLCKCNEIIMEDAEGNPSRLMIDRSQKLRPGESYRFYFKTPSGISPGKNPLFEKALLTDNLLGIESIELLSTTSDTNSAE